MSQPKFIGVWAGHGRGAQFGHAKVVISSSGNSLRAYGYARTSGNNVEVLEFEGVAESETRAVLDLIDFVTDDPSTNPPGNAQAIITYKENPEHLEAQFATDIGTHGTIWLRRASGFTKVALKIPPTMHKGFRRFKYWLRIRLRYLYLAAILVLTMLSIVGKTEGKISSVEALLLIVPLIFLFHDRVKGLLATLALRKLGPIEFESQANASGHTTPDQILHQLQNEFGAELPLFLTLTKLFIPRTKAVLRLMAADGRPITQPEFNKMAAGLGVPGNDLQATYDALVKSGCMLLGENGRLVVQEIGTRFLIFETRLAQLYQGG